jgi:hypothetical protein
LAASEFAFVDTVDLEVLTGPATNVTLVELASATPFNVTVTVAVPEVVDVSVAVHVPSPLSVKPLIVPRLVLITTAPSLLRTSTPFESSSCTVIVELLVPLAVTEFELRFTVEVPVLGLSLRTLISSVAVAPVK